jgi:adenine-specific DNA-methyltransferase
VLDVATGQGIFLTEAFRRFRELGLDSEDAAERLFGVELRKVACKDTVQRITNLTGARSHHIIKANFFDIIPGNKHYLGKRNRRSFPLFRAVVGNPPFIRYSIMTQATKRKALVRAEVLGFDASGSIDESVLFLLHATSFLEPDGRLAFIIPQRLLFTDYSSSVRNFLTRQFDSIRMIFCNGWKFGDTTENVVLLLATNGSQTNITVQEMNFGKYSKNGASSGFTDIGRWSALEAEALDSWKLLRFEPGFNALLKRLKALPGVHRLGDLARVEIGCVTGANRFFVLTRNEREESGIPDRYFVKAVSKANHIRGIYLDNSTWNKLFMDDGRCSLLKINKNYSLKHLKSLKRYLASGQKQGLKERYKIGNRAKWYCVPHYEPPTAFFTYMAHRHPRLVLNDTCAINTNSIHSIRLEGLPSLEFCTSFYNSLTLLSCELLGRIYGEGVLKLEPSELSGVLVVNPNELSIVADLLVQARSVHTKLLENEFRPVFDIVDEIVLSDGLRLSRTEITSIRSAYDCLVGRRLLR